MGIELDGIRSKLSRQNEASIRRAVYWTVLPFLAGLLLVFAIYHSTTGVPGRRILSLSESHTLESEAKLPGGALPCSSRALSASDQLATAEDLVHLEGALTKDSLSKVLGAAQSSDPQTQTVRVNEDTLPSIFLFVGVLSGRGYRHRRLAVREAWALTAQEGGQAIVRFILSEDERTPQVASEVEAHKDMIFLQEKTNYKSILYKTYFVMEYAATHYNARFVLKTDDDAFVNIQPLVQQLKLLCRNADCRNERIYMGKMAKDSEVLLQPGHKWNNIIFYNHTGLKQYPNYMMGGGYIVSGDVAQTLMNVNQRMRLKFTPIEDATMGFWLAAMDLVQIDHPRFYTWAAPCCFKPPVRRENHRIVTRFQLQDDMENDLCSDDPWLIMHKIDSPTKMRYLGNRVAACNFSDVSTAQVAASIADYVLQQTEAASKEQAQINQATQ